MTPKSRRWPEAAVLFALLATLCVFHALVLLHSGALWRDEIDLINISTTPWPELYGWLKCDSTPLGTILLCRGWIGAFGDSLLSMHVFGLLGGLLIIAAIFHSARRAGVLAPLAAIVLCAANPVTIYHGDSVRSYGYGNAAALLAVAEIWTLSHRRTWRNFLFALAASILAVHLLYQNAVFVGAFCVAGAVVAIWRRSARTAMLVVAAGGAAAISMTLYISTFRASANEAALIMRTHIGFGMLRETLGAAIESAGAWAPWVWGAVLIAAAVCGVAVMLGRDPAKPARRPDNPPPSEALRADRAAFFLLGTLIAGAAFWIFLLRVGLIPKPVYYVTLLAVASLAADVLLEPFVSLPIIRTAWFAGVVVCVIATIHPLWTQTHVRRTNMDLVAKRVADDAQTGDAILVLPWHMGVGFAYYYKGSIPFIVVPHITQLKAFASDQMKQQMQEADPLQPARDAMRTALAGGHTVWIVGDVHVLPDNVLIPPVGPAPDAKYGWDHAVYSQVYSMRIGEYVKSMATKAERVFPAPAGVTIDPMEAIELTIVTGYEGTATRP
jgi:hypothetical protein